MPRSTEENTVFLDELEPSLLPEFEFEGSVEGHDHFMQQSIEDVPSLIYNIPNMSGTQPYSVRLTGLQTLVYNSPYTQELPITAKVALALSYDCRNIKELGVDGVEEASLEFAIINKKIYCNIAYYLSHAYAASNAVVRIKDVNILKKFASIGVTKKEFFRIPLGIRNYLAMAISYDGVIFNREELEFLIDPDKYEILLSPLFLTSLIKIFNITPMMSNSLSINAACNIILNNAGLMLSEKLISVKISELGALYEKGPERLDYLVGWLQKYLQILNICKENSITEKDPEMGMKVDKLIYQSSVLKDFQYVIQLLSFPGLTKEDLAQSKQDHYDLLKLGLIRTRSENVLIFSRELNKQPQFSAGEEVVTTDQNVLPDPAVSPEDWRKALRENELTAVQQGTIAEFRNRYSMV